MTSALSVTWNGEKKVIQKHMSPLTPQRQLHKIYYNYYSILYVGISVG